MAHFVSVTDGPINDGATWGNTSPGVKGTDWPGLGDDTFEVSVGDTVSYNVSETNELGNCTVNGTLTFATTQNTLISFGNNTLSVSATGNLVVGTVGTPIGAAYTAEFSFNTTSDGSQGISFADGAGCSFYGDPNYITARKTTLANDAENTDGDDVIITNDDLSSDWHVGDEITILRESMGDGTSHNDAVMKTTISGLSGTQITVADNVTGVSSGVGDTWVSYVVNVTRNVRLYKYGASTAIANYNTNRPCIIDATTGVNSNVLSNVQITGFIGVQAQGITIDDCIIRNGRELLYNANYCTVGGAGYSLYYALNNTTCYNTINADIYATIYGSNTNIITANNVFNGDLYAMNTAFRGSVANVVNGDVFICNNAYNDDGFIRINGNVFACFVAFTDIRCGMFTGKLGYDPDDRVRSNTYDFSPEIDLHFNNVKHPSGGFVISARNNVGRYFRIRSSHADRTLNAFQLIDNFGTITKVPCDGTGDRPSVDPDSGNDPCLEVGDLQSNLSTYTGIDIFNCHEFAIYALASVSKTYTFKIQSTFTATLQNTEIILSAEYLNGSDGALTPIASTGTVATRSSASDWSQELSVTINPAQTGLIFFQIKLLKYESGAEIYIWPIAEIT